MTALIVLSAYQAKQLVCKAIAEKLKNTTKRVYISPGSTNQIILSELEINVDNYYNGYIDSITSTNTEKPDIVILNKDDRSFEETISSDDIIIKGANALCYENGRYKAGVAVASPNGGTYSKIFIKASCVGASVIIPVTHEKLVPTLLTGKYNQNSFHYAEEVPVALFELNYGRVYTEIDALKDIFSLDAEIYLSGSINTSNKSLAFVVTGEESSINKLLKWKS